MEGRQTQNRPQVRKVSYDPETSIEVARSGFADKHAIDRAVGFGGIGGAQFALAFDRTITGIGA